MKKQIQDYRKKVRGHIIYTVLVDTTLQGLTLSTPYYTYHDVLTAATIALSIQQCHVIHDYDGIAFETNAIPSTEYRLHD